MWGGAGAQRAVDAEQRGADRQWVVIPAQLRRIELALFLLHQLKRIGTGPDAAADFAADAVLQVIKLPALDETCHVREPTAEQMADLTALTTKPHRPYRDRNAGIRRQIARANGLHPIRDRAVIQSLLPRALALAKQAKRQCPRIKYRNIEITKTGVSAHWQTAGTMM